MDKKFVLWVILINILKANGTGNIFPPINPEPGFHVGRIDEGQYEYPSLNGWLTPEEAEKLCNKDLQCGGFTFKGANIKNQKRDTYFFHWVLNLSMDTSALKWTFYKANKTFLQFPGRFSQDGTSRRWRVLESSKAEAICLTMKSNCLAVGYRKEDSMEIAELFDYVDFEQFTPDPNSTTKIKLNLDPKSLLKSYELHSPSVYDSLDLCCPRVDKLTTKMKKKMHKNIFDTIPRIPCNISGDFFKEHYVDRRIAVVLENCTHDWGASSWTMRSLMDEKNGSLYWTVDMHISQKDPQLKMDVKRFRWHSKAPGFFIRKVMTNGTVRVFDKLGKRDNLWHRKKHGNKLPGDKLHLMKDYQTPGAIPEDYYSRAGLLTNYQWLILSQKDTGTGIHKDPLYTTPWNTVWRGSKWWALLPNDIHYTRVECDPRCSYDSDSELSWYVHVLPQLKNRMVYGQPLVREMIQSAGETIYLPGSADHAVMNLEDNLSVTENYMLNDNLEEYIHGILMGGHLFEDDDFEPSSHLSDEEKLYKQLYYKILKRKDRAMVRAMMKQVEDSINKNPSLCQQWEQETEEVEEEDYEEHDDDSEEVYD